jgi:hypothetical protein
VQDGAVKAFAFLPKRIHADDYISIGDAADALLTDGYILADFGPMKAGEKKVQTFIAK